MQFGRRTLLLLLAVALLGVPAGIARVLCLGRSCDRPVSAASEVPFCSLPPPTRDRIEAGFREGRSPDLVAVARAPGIAGGSGFTRSELAPPWPALGREGAAGGRVPILFSGTGVVPGATVPDGTGLDDIAPTVASIIGLDRPHPEVRSGTAVEGVADGTRPRLVLEVVLAGLGSTDLARQPDAWPHLQDLMSSGAATMDGDIASLPLDPIAALATIGTGGLPRQHGITGTLIRNDEGELVRAFGPGAPVSVIAALGDDLDETLEERPRVGVVGGAPGDRAAIGGNWYLGSDRDDVVIDPRDQVTPALELLRGGDYGSDAVPDLLVVALRGSVAHADAALRRLTEAARRASEGSLTTVVTATGVATGTAELRPADVVRSVTASMDDPAEVVEAAVPGGLFLDQDKLAQRKISEDDVLAALRNATGADGRRLFADAFPAIAVSFARYC